MDIELGSNPPPYPPPYEDVDPPPYKETESTNISLINNCCTAFRNIFTMIFYFLLLLFHVFVLLTGSFSDIEPCIVNLNNGIYPSTEVPISVMLIYTGSVGIGLLVISLVAGIIFYCKCVESITLNNKCKYILIFIGVIIILTDVLFVLIESIIGFYIYFYANRTTCLGLVINTVLGQAIISIITLVLLIIIFIFLSVKYVKRHQSLQ
jgi:hypothetical protein